MDALIFIGGVASLATGLYLRDGLMLIVGVLTISPFAVQEFTKRKRSRDTAKAKAALIERFSDEQQHKKGGHPDE